VTAPVFSSPQEIDLQIGSLKAFVDESWSNLAIVERLERLFYLVPLSNRKARRCFAAAVRTARTSGSVYLIKTKINRLHAALKEPQ
jgi:hypothetical protein